RDRHESMLASRAHVEPDDLAHLGVLEHRAVVRAREHPPHRDRRVRVIRKLSEPLAVGLLEQLSEPSLALLFGQLLGLHAWSSSQLHAACGRPSSSGPRAMPELLRSAPAWWRRRAR